MTSYGIIMSMKILCTMKSVKQQIWHFPYVLHSKQSLHKNYHTHVLYNFCSLYKITKIINKWHLNYTLIFLYRTYMTYIFHTKYISRIDQATWNHIFLMYILFIRHFLRNQHLFNLNKAT